MQNKPFLPFLPSVSSFMACARNFSGNFSGRVSLEPGIEVKRQIQMQNGFCPEEIVLAPRKLANHVLITGLWINGKNKIQAPLEGAFFRSRRIVAGLRLSQDSGTIMLEGGWLGHLDLGRAGEPISIGFLLDAGAAPGELKFWLRGTEIR
mgnify:CR=1 FL=1